MSIRINGTLAPIAQPPEITYDPSRGQLVSQKWDSAGQGLAGIANTLLALRLAYKFNPSNVHSTLVAEASGSQLGFTDLTCDTWQILANELQRDLKEFPGFASKQASYQAAFRYTLRDVNNYLNGDPPGDPAPDTAAMPETGYLFNLLIRGSTHYALSQYVLRHTTSVSNMYSANVSDMNIGRVYTTAQLLSEVTSASSWVYPLPGRLVYKLQNIAAPPAQENYLWGWRKLASPETGSANNRIEISTEYWLEQWHSFVYPPIS